MVQNVFFVSILSIVFLIFKIFPLAYIVIYLIYVNVFGLTYMLNKYVTKQIATTHSSDKQNRVSKAMFRFSTKNKKSNTISNTTSGDTTNEYNKNSTVVITPTGS